MIVVAIRTIAFMSLCVAGAARAERDGLAACRAGAIGDSISTGFNAQRLGDNRDLSWATGTKPEIDSHLKKISTQLGAPVVGRNEAVAGSTVHDLGDQITRVLAYQ